LLKAWQLYPTLASRRFDTAEALRLAIISIEQEKTVGDALVELHRLPDKPIKDEGTTADARHLLGLISKAPDIDEVRKAVEGNKEAMEKLIALATPDKSDAPEDPNEGNGDDPNDPQVATSGDNPDDPKDPDEGDEPKLGNRTPYSERLLNSRLEQAQQEEAAGDTVAAYRAYKWLATKAAASDQGRTAIKKVADYEADETFMAKLEQDDAQKQARAMLSLAKSYRDVKRYDLARVQCLAVIEAVPGTDLAKEAQDLLDELPEE
jgi:hypothetical protein